MGERINISRHEAWVTDDLGNIIGVVGPAGKKQYFYGQPDQADSDELIASLGPSLTGKRLYLAPATYTISALIQATLSRCEIIGVPGLTKIAGNFATDAGGGTINAGLLRLLECSGVRFYGITFENTFSSALLDTGQGVVYSYQSNITDVEFERCEFTAPNCGTNGPSFYPRINTTDTSAAIDGLRIIRCHIHDIGRVGCTFMQRNTAAGAELSCKGVVFSENRVSNLGLVDPNGIGVSLDGNGVGRFDDNEFANCRGIGIENTGWTRTRVVGNRARDFRSGRAWSFMSWYVQGGRRISRNVIAENLCLEAGNQRNNFIGLDDCRFSDNVFQTSADEYAVHVRDSNRNKFSRDQYISANAGAVVVGTNTTTTQGNEWTDCVADNSANGAVGTLVLFDGASTTDNVWRRGDLKKGTGGSYTGTSNSAVYELEDVALDGVRRFGYRIINMSDANITLSEHNAQSRYLRFSGTLTAGRTAFFPNVDRNYVIHNSTGQTLTLDVGGVTTTVAAGVKATISWQKTSSTWYNFGVMT